jgi:hypothetical protein
MTDEQDTIVSASAMPCSRTASILGCWSMPYLRAILLRVHGVRELSDGMTGQSLNVDGGWVKY